MPPRSVFRRIVDKEELKTKKGGEFFKILKYSSSKFLIGIAFIFAIGQGVIMTIMPMLLGDMVDTMSTGTEFNVDKTIKKMIIMNVCQILISFLQNNLRAACGASLTRDLRRLTYKNMLEQDMTFFDRVPTGLMIGRLSQDITLIHDIYIDRLIMTVSMGSQACAGIIVSLTKCWRIGLPCIAVIVICVLVHVIGEKLIDKIWETYNESSSLATNKAEEVLSSFRTIKSFDNEMYEAGLYDESLKQVNGVFKKTSIAQGTKNGLIVTIAHMMLAAIMYFGSYLIIRKPYLGYTNGVILVFVMTMVMAVFGMSQAFSISDDMCKTAISADKIIELINLKPKFYRNQGSKLENVNGKIEFKNVCFRYTPTSPYAVKNLTFTINPGETVAFVGESGCGKSTTLQLIEKFYEIESGKILIDGKDISKISGVELRKFISIVPQTPVLFTMSVMDNIRYAKKDASKEEVINAAQIGNAHNFIINLPQQYKSIVQQTKLSGGQKQRICISRAILSNSQILLLDEATAALDTESEKLVQDSLEKFRHGKTAILVAHRLATVKNADRILVFRNGQIYEEGNHEELLAKGGFYADLVKYQLQ